MASYNTTNSVSRDAHNGPYTCALRRSNAVKRPTRRLLEARNGHPAILVQAATNSTVMTQLEPMDPVDYDEEPEEVVPLRRVHANEGTQQTEEGATEKGKKGKKWKRIGRLLKELVS